MTQTRRSTARALALGAALSCAVACRPPSETEAAKLERTVQERELPRVRTEDAQRREMLRTFETSTTVESEFEVTVFPRSPGLVVEVLAEEGDRVVTDSVLARLDDREARNALAEAELLLTEAGAALPKLELARREAEARRANAERSWKQADRDHERNESIATGASGSQPGLISQKELDQSRLARDTARGELETTELALLRAELEEADGKNAVSRARLGRDQAALSLSYTELLAPYDGVIARRQIRLGDSVTSAGSPAFVLTDPDHLRAVFPRPQRELPLFTQTEPAASDGSSEPFAIEIRATAEALPGREFHGEIERVSPTIDPASGNFRVTVRLDPVAENDASARLLPGMLVRLAVVTDRRPDALVVPKRAIRRQGDEGVLFVVRDGHALRLAVTEGYSDDELVEVLVPDGELEAGEPVIVVGNRDLEAGAAVEVVGPDNGPVEPAPDAPTDAEGSLEAPAAGEPVAGDGADAEPARETEEAARPDGADDPAEDPAGEDTSP